ncbi:DUF3572 domain-containing protein [Falsigemmobacter intermedius]|uniref:DUF3572 family protein n=1 Tax=Falsigemmobacter intermedius TaxID=1553448 RepID=A0A444MAU2_9RHOB|nr:DUF3572 domain-containing protein [Falsigemmobacter intermedius]RWY40569.1 DUF3572 family protein [Falsigemmobacter intermedius]
MKRDLAETLALQALGWIASEDELFGVFLNATGASQSDLREQAGNAHFLGAVLDFILQEDDRVLRFAEAAGVAPTAPGQARQVLPGGETPHWT